MQGLSAMVRNLDFIPSINRESLACFRQTNDWNFIFKRAFYLLHEVTRVEAGRLGGLYSSVVKAGDDGSRVDNVHGRGGKKWLIQDIFWK